jgi:hypothetical protein
LRTIGYGGGYPVLIEVKNEQLKQRLRSAETELVLRTNDTLIVFDKKSRSYLEVPRDEAVYISYGRGEIRY